MTMVRELIILTEAVMAAILAVAVLVAIRRGNLAVPQPRPETDDALELLVRGQEYKDRIEGVVFRAITKYVDGLEWPPVNTDERGQARVAYATRLTDMIVDAVLAEIAAIGVEQIEHRGETDGAVAGGHEQSDE